MQLTHSEKLRRRFKDGYGQDEGHGYVRTSGVHVEVWYIFQPFLLAEV